MKKILQFFGLEPTDEEQEILNKLNSKECSTIRVIGKALIKDINEIRNNDKARSVLKMMEDLDIK